MFIGSHLHGRLYAKNLQLYQRFRDPSFNRLVIKNRIVYFFIGIKKRNLFYLRTYKDSPKIYYKIYYSLGTYEKVEEEEEEIYEVINVHKLKSATPNLRVINLYGINFVDDSHIDAFSSNCIQLECLAVNFCAKVTGSTMKTLFQRSRRLKCLLMQGTSEISLSFCNYIDITNISCLDSFSLENSFN